MTTAPRLARRVPVPRTWPIRAGDVVALVLGNGALILAMWIRHGGPSELSSPAGTFTAIGELTALFGTYAVLLELVLMSRSPWLEPARVARVLLLRDGAVATSGIYERGLPIVDSRTGRPPSGLLSLTVVGPSLTYADAFATAAFAMGPDGVAWVARQQGYGAFAVTEDHRSVWTPLIDRLLD